MLETNAVETTETTEVEVSTAPERPKSYYDQKRIRTGKTRRDHDSGAWRRRFDNNGQRAAWRNDTKTKTQGIPPFPVHTCKGLGNSSKRYKVQAGKVVG